MRQCVTLALIFVGTLSSLGCRSGWEADYSALGLVEVGGKVSLDGQPLSGAMVIFEAEDRTYSSGTTDSAGQYKLMFDSTKSGVLPGVKTVRIRLGGGGGEESPAEGEAPKPKSTDKVPACYNSKSELKANVTSSGTMNFSLKSDCSTKAPD